MKIKGKYLICVLDNYYLIVHLRMEGKFFLMHDEKLSSHDHIIFKFNDSNLRYNDTRKFGTMHLFERNIDIYNCAPLNKVGLEPFDKDFNTEYLVSFFNKSSKPIKTTLLDQSIIAGLGNIYVDEVLFMCGIHPQEKTKLLSLKQIIYIVRKFSQFYLTVSYLSCWIFFLNANFAYTNHQLEKIFTVFVRNTISTRRLLSYLPIR